MTKRHTIQTVLLVEDNDGDALLLKEAFKEQGFTPHIHVEKDGESAINYIKGICNKKTAVLPDLIFLDINIPRYNGHLVLDTIRSFNAFNNIPVLMYSSSNKTLDVDVSYENGAMSYIRKSLDFDDTVQMVKKVLTVYGKIYGEHGV